MIDDEYRADPFGVVRTIAQVSDAMSRRLGGGGSPGNQKSRIQANRRYGEAILDSV